MKIINTIFYWLFVFGVTGVFTYLVFWQGYSGWWYLMALLLIGAVGDSKPKENENKDKK